MKILVLTIVFAAGFGSIFPMDSVFAKTNNKKYKITEVVFEDFTIFSKGQLKQTILSRPSGLFHKSWYYPEVLDDDLISLELLYHQNGYLEARILEHQVAIDSTRKEVHIRFKIFEGERTFIEGISFFGNRIFTDETLQSGISLRPGAPFLRKKLEESTLSLLTMYANSGFLDASINTDIHINSELHRAIIDYKIDEKAKSQIDSIRILGLEKTKEIVVQRELRFKPGTDINYSKLLETQRRLYLTGLFKSVFIRPRQVDAQDSTRKDMIVDLVENETGEFNVSIGYESVEKLRGRIEFYNANLDGSARKVGLAARASSINQGFEASFTEPWTFGIPWQTDINFLIDHIVEPGYDLNRTGGKITFGRSFLRRSNVKIIYRQERTTLPEIRVLEVPERLKNSIRSLKISFVFDTRDNLFNSTNGFYFEVTNELAGSFLSGTNSFVRSEARLKYFITRKLNTTFASSIDFGWMDATGGLDEIPLQERYYTGGPNTIRAFGYQKVGPLDEKGVPTGGRTKLVINLLEIRRTLYKVLGGVIFLEAGNVWTKPEKCQLCTLRPAAGIGIRINTPIGLARLDYGFNLDRREGEDARKLYFSMGQAF